MTKQTYSHSRRWPGALSLLFMLAFLSTGCQTTTSRIAEKQKLFNQFPAETQALIRNGQLALGFSPDMTWMALGPPTQRYIKETTTGTQEIWSYHHYKSVPSFNNGSYCSRCRLWHSHNFHCSHSSATQLVPYESRQVVFEQGKIVEIKELQ